MVRGVQKWDDPNLDDPKMDDPKMDVRSKNGIQNRMGTHEYINSVNRSRIIMFQTIDEHL